MNLNFWSSCVYLVCARITRLCHYACLVGFSFFVSSFIYFFLSLFLSAQGTWSLNSKLLWWEQLSSNPEGLHAVTEARGWAATLLKWDNLHIPGTRWYILLFPETCTLTFLSDSTTVLIGERRHVRERNGGSLASGGLQSLKINSYQSHLQATFEE